MRDDQQDAIINLIRTHLNLILENRWLRAVLDAAEQNGEIRRWKESFQAVKDSPAARDAEAQHAQILVAFEQKFQDDQLAELLAKLPPTGLPN